MWTGKRGLVASDQLPYGCMKEGESPLLHFEWPSAIGLGDCKASHFVLLSEHIRISSVLLYTLAPITEVSMSD